jgi:hypothetical protein
MSRLITFGCSFTDGASLQDPNTQSWPAVLGKLTNRVVINNGRSGSSNLEILSQILSFDFQKDDLVVTGWTYCNRDVIFKKNKEGQQVTAWTDGNIFEKWSELYDDYNIKIRSGMYIHHAELYLNNLQIKNYGFWAVAGPAGFIDIALTKIFNNAPPLPIFVKKDTLYKNILNTEDYASDNAHPGPAAHTIAAKKLYRIINGE